MSEKQRTQTGTLWSTQILLAFQSKVYLENQAPIAVPFNSENLLAKFVQSIWGTLDHNGQGRLTKAFDIIYSERLSAFGFTSRFLFPKMLV